MDINQLGTLALVLVVAAIIISMGGEILDQLAYQQTNDSIAQNATEAGLEGIQTFSNWLPLLALVVVASIVIGVIVKYMGGAGGV